jgi:allophanate hydrolase
LKSPRFSGFGFESWLFGAMQGFMNLSLDFASLRAAYASGRTPQEVIGEIYDRIAARSGDKTWIHLVPREHALAAAAKLATIPRDAPLWGIPFAIKDNIDLAGAPTTAACPDFSYLPAESAFVVARLISAGAIAIGKTNLDQFATGLVGVRSPYGVPENTFDKRYVPGGSSSGSAVAVAAGLVSFALGTDTAGSGRVPAGFNNLVGLKPTKGLFSTRGLVPACRTLDVISIFALTVEDARIAGQVAAAFDAEDPYSRDAAASAVLDPQNAPAAFRFGVPQAAGLEFFGDAQAKAAFAAACARLKKLGGIEVPFDFSALKETASLLYDGPWVAERYAAIETYMRDKPEALHPITRAVIANAARFDAVATFKALYRLEALKRRAAALWRQFDVLVVPTSGTIFTLEQLAAEPVRHNTELGYYTNFVNLLDMSALAVPAAIRPDGLPCGITLIGPAFADGKLAAIGAAFHRNTGLPLGATGARQPAQNAAAPVRQAAESVQLAVVGAHLTGMPLNSQLAQRGAKLVRNAATSKRYRLYALANTTPPKPGLVRVDGAGDAIALEIWEMSMAAFGSFVAEVPPPMAIGTIELDDGTWCKGFVCEPNALADAADITAHRGWRAYLQHRDAQKAAQQ